MVEQDYITRLIREIARVLAKILFNMDSDDVTEELKDRLENSENWKELKRMIDTGKINEAENCLDDLRNEEDSEYTEIAILFYLYLNDMPEDFLEENGFSKEEVKMGMEQVADDLGLSGLADVF